MSIQMINPKPHLKKIFRTRQPRYPRFGKLRLDMNENVNGLPRSFIKKVFSEVTPEYLAAYPEFSRLEARIAEYNGLKEENICLSNGSDAAIKYIFDAYIGINDRVLLTNPTFAMYPVYCRIFKATAEIVNYKKDFEFPYGVFLEKIRPGLKLAVLVNPNNPAGSVLEHAKIRRIVTKARTCGAIVIVDEAYFYYYPKTVIADILKFDNLIVLRTFSKICGIASLRVGYAASNARIIDNLKKVKPTFDVNGAAILMAERILDNPYIIRNHINQINEAKKYLVSRLLQAKIKYKLGFGNFILIHCPKKCSTIATKLKKSNILVHANLPQGLFKDYLRVTIGDKKTMERFLRVFLKILNNQKKCES